MILGIDVYQGDGQVNFNLMRLTPVEVVICKLSKGNDLDLAFPVNYAGARGISRQVKAYHFYDYRVSPQKQAELVLKNLPGDIELIADSEYITYLNTSRVRITVPVPKGYEDNFKSFVEILAARIPVMIYSNKSFFEQYCPNAIYWANRFRLWVANFKVGWPALPLPWSDFWGWQFTDRGPGRKFGLVSLMADLSYIREQE